MRFTKLLPLLAISLIFVLMLNASQGGALAQSTPDATLNATMQGTQVVPNCASAALATAPSAVILPATLEATLSATANAEPTALVTQEADAPLHFLSFLPTDMKFNPCVEKPVVVVIVFSLVFQNQLGDELHVENLQFELAIDDVQWGKLASTDFQTGQLVAHATHGIVLQSLTIVGKTNDSQKAILECMKMNAAVDLTLTGTVDAYPGGNKQTVKVRLLVNDIIIRGRH